MSVLKRLDLLGVSQAGSQAARSASLMPSAVFSVALRAQTVPLVLHPLAAQVPWTLW